MDEFQLIEHFFRGRPLGAGVRLGPGDDAAVLVASAGHELLMTMDTLVSGRHFPEDLPPYDIGWRSLAVNLSDLAAMGADPRWCLLSLSLPQANQDWLAEFCRGFYALAEQESISLVGGDMVRGALQITIQASGEAPQGAALLRSGAKVGDRICIGSANGSNDGQKGVGTRTPGDAALGLLHWQAGKREGAAVRHFARPQPQLALGRTLRGQASACIDISDGLLADLEHIVRESQVPGAAIALDKLPLSSALRAHPDPAQRIRLQLSGGDDYMLLFCLPAAHPLPSGCCEIGVITAEEGISVYDESGDSVVIAERGWTHF
ncbi:MAG: thiamine-phosphate kinase [Gammaproteobacteria bacterium]|jgi:thiamine-monophosphate kinase|nr:thiamine-phosphate kinase [Gammaproteobacteria bacterium]MBQ0775078.1 thiamine-phosphate kinase [Gammaproteobacteria bacterium]